MSGQWNVFTDQKTGVKYYANSVTMEVTWECPPELAHLEKEEDAALAASTPVPTAVTVDAPKEVVQTSQAMLDWSSAVDENSKRTYYFNTKTHETRWDPPPGWSTGDHNTTSPTHTKTASTSSALSATSAATSVGAASSSSYASSPPHSQTVSLGSAAAFQPPVSPASPMWDKVLDPNSQRHYYVNRETNQTQWEQPPAHLIATQPRFTPTHTPNASADMGAATTISHKGHERKVTAEAKQVLSFIAGGTKSPLAGQGDSHRKLPTPLQADILKFGLDGFAQQHFRQKKTGFLSRKIVPVSDMIVWQKKPISKSLLQSSKKNNSDAVSLFKQIQTVMGDIESRKSPSMLANKIVTAGVNKPRLRDEIYCQLCKQLTKNPNQESIERGWTLFALCVSGFCPSRSFEDFLRAFVAKNFDGKGEVARLAPFSWWRLHRTITICPEEDPSKLQWRYVVDLMKRGVPSEMVTFGGSLDYIMETQRQQGHKEEVPRVLLALTKAVLDKGGAQTRGMFRIASDKFQKLALKEQFVKGNYEVKDDNPHTAGDLLKIWLRELQEPVIPEVHYDAALALARKPEAIYEFCQKNLSHDHFATLDYLIRWLKQFTAHAAVTSMSEENLAIVFCQNLLQKKNQDPHKAMLNSEREKDFLKNAIIVWPSP